MRSARWLRLLPTTEPPAAPEQSPEQSPGQSPPEQSPGQSPPVSWACSSQRLFYPYLYSRAMMATSIGPHYLPLTLDP
jgi:hypothetical protein